MARKYKANQISFMLLLVILSLGLLWILFSQYGVPPLIKNAYQGASWPIFNRMISGQASHPVGVYLSEWDRLRWRTLTGLLVVGLLAVLAIRPELQRPLRRPLESDSEPSEEKSPDPAAIGPRFPPGFVVLAVLVLTGAAAARIVSTYHIFNQTADEPDHVGAGMEWLSQGTYTLDPEGPPLARVAVALGPFLDGLRLPASRGDGFDLGTEIFYARDHYSRNLTLARLGVLPFFFMAIAAVFLSSRKIFGDTTALLAVALFTTLPPVLAHAGLATSDMALTATFTAAMLALITLLERPTYRRCCMFGLTAGLTVLAKLSALLFLPACGVAVLASYWVARPGTVSLKIPWRRRAAAMALIAATTFSVIWSGYRFSVHPIRKTDNSRGNIGQVVSREGSLHRLASLVAERVPIPAPEFVIGINMLRSHALKGHPSYLLGEVRHTGWWYFFPIALAVKSPVPFLVLSGIGFASLIRQAWRRAHWQALAPAAMALTLLLACMPSRINIGVRHILPIYPLLAMVAAFGAVSLWNLAKLRRLGPAIVLALLLWQLTASVLAHPDYLAYFNPLAGRHPDEVLLVSDLDWGQDLLRLGRELHERKIDSVALAYHGSAQPWRHKLPRLRDLPPCQPTTGWIAISEAAWKMGWGGPLYRDRVWAWLDAYEPRAMIGKSLRLYYIPEAPPAKDVSCTTELSAD